MTKYSYQYRNGGFVGFEGSTADLKEVSELTAEISDGHITIETEFADGCTKGFECDFERPDENSIKLTDLKKYWNNAPVG